MLVCTGLVVPAKACTHNPTTSQVGWLKSKLGQRSDRRANTAHEQLTVKSDFICPLLMPRRVWVIVRDSCQRR
jgi:hypothetical protein